MFNFVTLYFIPATKHEQASIRDQPYFKLTIWYYRKVLITMIPQNFPETIIKPGAFQPKSTWFLEMDSVQTSACSYVCVFECVCVSTPKAVSN